MRTRPISGPRNSIPPTGGDPSEAMHFELRAFDPDRDVVAVAELISEARAFDGLEEFVSAERLQREWAPTANFVPARDAVVTEDADRRIVGAVAVDWRQRNERIVHGVELTVGPAARRRGLGRRLVDWAEHHVRAAIDEGNGGPAELPHFLGGPGIQRRRRGAGGRQRLPSPPVWVRHAPHARRGDRRMPLPAGLEVRPVRADQHRKIWDADVEAFRDHWEATRRLEDDFVQTFTDPDTDTGLWQVAWDGNEVAGSVMNTIYREENERLGAKVGWLDHVSVRRPWRGRGLATSLVAASLRVLRERGLDEAALGVDAENPTGALRLYERLGFRRHRSLVTYRKAL